MTKEQKEMKEKCVKVLEWYGLLGMSKILSFYEIGKGYRDAVEKYHQKDGSK